MKKLVCEECGSDDVQQKAWVNPNSLEIDFSLSENFEEEDTWCSKCSEHMGLVDEDKFVGDD